MLIKIQQQQPKVLLRLRIKIQADQSIIILKYQQQKREMYFSYE